MHQPLILLVHGLDVIELLLDARLEGYDVFGVFLIFGYCLTRCSLFTTFNLLFPHFPVIFHRLLRFTFRRPLSSLRLHLLQKLLHLLLFFSELLYLLLQGFVDLFDVIII